MAKEIGAGIYQIKLPLPWAIDLMPFSAATINVYLVHSEQHLMLVDSGLNNLACWDKLKSEMRYLGFDFSQLTDLVATHCHPDHIGLLDGLNRCAPEARVHLHPHDRSLIQERFFRPQSALVEFKNWLTGHGLPPSEEIKLAAVRLEVGQFSQSPYYQPAGTEQCFELNLDGQSWQLICTPGHTPGHLVLYQPEQQLMLTGDQLFATSSPNISKFPGSSENPLEDYLASLRQLSGLTVELAWPGHGEAFGNFAARSEKVARQHERKLLRLVETLGKDALTAYEIAGRLWGEAKQDLDGNSRRLALTEIMAQLTWLKQKDFVISETDRAGLTRYLRKSEPKIIQLPANYDVILN